MNAQSKPNRLGGDKSYHDPTHAPNHALAGLQVLQGKVPVAVDTPPPAEEAAAPMTDVVRAVTEEPPHDESGVVAADGAPSSAATDVVVVEPVVEETLPNDGGAQPASKVYDGGDRRSPFRTASRAHVASAQARAAMFTVAPLIPPEPEQVTWKAKQPLSKDAPWERVTLGLFKKSKNVEMLSLVREIRNRGVRPVMTMEIRAPEGAGTRVDFGLSIAVERGGYEHVKLTPLDGAGLFGWLFQGGVEVFHDEVVGEKPASPDRYLATVGVNSAVNMVDSFLASVRATRQQR